MNKSAKLLSVIENELRTSTNGKIPHSHPEIFDDEGILIDVGPANNGPKHKHGIVKDRTSGKVIGIGTAGDTNPNDPEHDHAPSRMSPAKEMPDAK